MEYQGDPRLFFTKRVKGKIQVEHTDSRMAMVMIVTVAIMRKEAGSYRNLAMSLTSPTYQSNESFYVNKGARAFSSIATPLKNVKGNANVNCKL